MYSISDPFAERSVYPVFDVEWYSTDLVERSGRAAQRIAAIRKLAAGAAKLVNACDFDIEGEVIGANVLRYACSGREDAAYRAKFSTLTRDELVSAFRNAKQGTGMALARAGRARHLIDFVWGVNLSRALSKSVRDQVPNYWDVTVGRVQGPALSFVTDREKEIRTFVPVPYWKASALFEGRDGKVRAEYKQERLREKTDAEQLRKDCVGQEAVAARVTKSFVNLPPPPPFNTGDLQKEAYRVFRFSPSRTLQIAQKLYLDALVSYPRTSSQKVPPSVGYGQILRGLGRDSKYSEVVAEVLRNESKPVQGPMDDQAHPAIYPTGEESKRAMGFSEASVYDLVVRRFLAAFGPAAKCEDFEVYFTARGHEFRVRNSKIVHQGWMRLYGKYSIRKSSEPPSVSEGDTFRVADVELVEKFDQPPIRYNESSLLERMEREGLGTKSTRAGVISTLSDKRYVQGRDMVATDLGLLVAEMMQSYAPSLTSSKLTHEIEKSLDGIEAGEDTGAVTVRDMIRSIAHDLKALQEVDGRTGISIGRAAISLASGSDVLGRCPVCKVGQLKIVRSKKTGKRFVGCSDYYSGCRASAPLPQKGTIRRGEKPCEHCSWPVVFVLRSRRPWKLCVNPSCPSKKVGDNEVQNL